MPTCTHILTLSRSDIHLTQRQLNIQSTYKIVLKPASS